MLPFSTIDHILELLTNSKLSHRKIACMVGVSRGTVDGVARGKIAHLSEKRRFGVNRNYDASSVIYDLPIATCPKCHRLGVTPCVVCRSEECDSNEQRIDRQKNDHDVIADTSLQLVNGSRERWLWLQRQKKIHGESAYVFTPLCEEKEQQELLTSIQSTPV